MGLSMGWRRAGVLAATIAAAVSCDKAGDDSRGSSANNPLAAPPKAEPADPAPRAAAVEAVTIASNPSGAGVFLNGAELGTTPYELKFKAETRIELRLAGHVTKEVLITPGGDPIVTTQLEADPNQQVAAATAANSPKSTPKSRSRSSAKAAAPRAAQTASPSAPAPAGTGYAVPDRRGGIAGAWDRATGNDERRARRHRLLARGPQYTNFRDLKKAHKGGMLTKDDYNDHVWVLKTMKADQLKQAQRDFDAGRITLPQFEERRSAITRKFEIGQ